MDAKRNVLEVNRRLELTQKQVKRELKTTESSIRKHDHRGGNVRHALFFPLKYSRSDDVQTLTTISFPLYSTED
jgi:hypothetical protein